MSFYVDSLAFLVDLLLPILGGGVWLHLSIVISVFLVLLSWE